MSESQARRYAAVAIVLHWAIALGIIWQIGLGWWMGDALEHPDTQATAVAAFQVHKSVGLTVLALSLVRLWWRLANPPPALPAHMPAWEKTAATATHWAFYVLMIAMPLSGWLYVSAEWDSHSGRPLEVPTLFFGLFQVPHIPGLESLADGARGAVSGVLEFVHSKMAWVAIILLVLHVGAALKHQFKDRDEVLGHMVPGATPKTVELPPASPNRRYALIGGFAAIVLFFAFAFSQIKAGLGAPAAAESAPQATQQQAGALPAEQEPALSPPSAPPLWRVDQSQSAIRFSGAHAGAPFEGRFQEWRAEIRFDPDNLAQSSAMVTVATGSARDGVPLHESSLPQEEWFDTANYPTATFRVEEFRQTSDGYEARGVLNLKGRDLPVRLPFTLSIDGDRAAMDGEALIERDEADLGQSSDPGGDWVSKEIRVSVHVEAQRAQ